jgi:hypothetical protein
LRAKALPRAFEKSLPFTIEAPEGRLELIPDELSSERLKAYRRPNRAVFVNRTVDVGRIALKRCSAQHNLPFDGELHNSLSASRTSRGCDTGPFAVIWCGGVSVVELLQNQQESGRSDDARAVHRELSLLRHSTGIMPAFRQTEKTSELRKAVSAKPRD